MQLNTKKNDAFCSHIFDYACFRRKAYRYGRGSKLQKKLHTPKTFLKMAGGRMHTPHPTLLNQPLAINYRNHQKILAYFSHSAPLVWFLFTKRWSQKGGPWHNALSLNMLLARSLRLGACERIISSFKRG